MSFEVTYSFDADSGIELIVDGSKVGFAEGDVTYGFISGDLCVTELVLSFGECDRPVRKLSTEAVPHWREALNSVAQKLDGHWPLLLQAQDAWQEHQHDTMGVTYQPRAA